MTEAIFAVDLGATWLRSALVDPARRLAMKAVAATPDRAADACAIIDAAWRRAGCPRAVALASAPELTADAMVRRWPNRRAYEGGSLLSTTIRDAAVVAMVDDAAAAAIAAHPFERRDAGPTICISIGSGIGGGAVIDGVPLTGANGAAMDLGHMPVPSATGLRCSCGRVGCLQAAASGFALRDLVAASPDALLQSPDVASALQRASAALGEAIVIVNAVFDPARIAIAGGLGLSPLFDQIEAELIARHITVSIARHRCGDDAGLVGAAIGFGLNRTAPGRVGHDNQERVVSHAD
ncbi:MULTISPECIES: ROK family protein [Rhodopseudomonas]|uniref:ROK family protein n=1 Tax=Rhodopseudomonas palustris TaxID=1076 RepID=A0A0D7EH45_RHOPL|nr:MULTISPECIES: ROK family protein [Rhodopseudomonas]KIZ38837.1 hypothetical protein OO17_22420 [Rhodopseudomonas palustris]MDF3808917.1 ROK family protein [Rhodopseudomonas sp. BAL398]WOK18374.1 ROK family protein [Rhodopseudomonas sp. BAL398]